MKLFNVYKENHQGREFVEQIEAVGPEDACIIAQSNNDINGYALDAVPTNECGICQMGINNVLNRAMVFISHDYHRPLLSQTEAQIRAFLNNDMLVRGLSSSTGIDVQTIIDEVVKYVDESQPDET